MTAKYKTITIGPGTKFNWGKTHSWSWVGYHDSPLEEKTDENGFTYTHILDKGTVTIKIEDPIEKEHEKENLQQNPTGKRMIQL